ncbi:hypothetical protein B0G82_6930 [Paraburkholderia sp. BL17N1]|nr:hypothetical protein B0G82_6930 [Paraburkholderia sp. BL17N1]
MKVAVIQAAPVPLDRAATIVKAWAWAFGTGSDGFRCLPMELVPALDGA